MHQLTSRARRTRRNGEGDATGLRSTVVASVCAAFSLFYVVIVLGCSAFCFNKGHGCGGDGQVFYLPFFLFPFCLMTSVLFVLTLCARVTSRSRIKLALALIALVACPSLLAVFVRQELYLTTVVFLLPVTASLLGGGAYLSYALARKAV